MKWCAKAILLLSAAFPMLGVPVGGEAQAAPPQAEALQTEDSDVTTMKAFQPHWLLAGGGVAINIFDGDSGKMQGQVPNYEGDFAVGPGGSAFYTVETFYAHRNRGQRDDVLTIWNPSTLEVVKEIKLPGRLLEGGRVHNFVLTADGSKALIYSMLPTSSAYIVDLTKQEVEGTVEIPGCATLLPNPAGFSALCSNGTLASVALSAGGKPVVARSAPFFSATADPIFDNSALDPATGVATLLSYSGLIYEARLGREAQVNKPWSIQEAAGMRRPDGNPLNPSWFPGGLQPIAVHEKSGRIYILMHIAEFWSQNAGGREIWVLDRAKHTLLYRVDLPETVEGRSIQVTQDDSPKIFVTGKNGDVLVYDAQTNKQERVIEKANPGGTFGPGLLYVKP